MPEDNRKALYDLVFVESIIEEINEILLEKYASEDAMPVLGIVRKEDIPGDAAVWVHMFKTEDVKAKAGK
jgi:hypothetical protein